MKTVFVTGGAGFIGSGLVRMLIGETSLRVVIIDALTYAANLDSLVTVSDTSQYMFEHADICESARLQVLFERWQPDAVVHLAAESHVDRSIDGPGDFIRTNVVGTFSLLQETLRYWKTLPDVGR